MQDPANWTVLTSCSTNPHRASASSKAAVTLVQVKGQPGAPRSMLPEKEDPVLCLQEGEFLFLDLG